MAISIDARGGNAAYYSAVRGQEALSDLKRAVREARGETVSPSGEKPDTGERSGLKRLAVFRGSDTFVPNERRPEYVTRVTPPQSTPRTGT